MKNKIRGWVKSLNEETRNRVLIECIEELINTETVDYPNQCKSPYWDSTGDALDGIDDNWGEANNE